jgi:hypothetical protein
VGRAIGRRGQVAFGATSSLKLATLGLEAPSDRAAIDGLFVGVQPLLSLDLSAGGDV